LNLAGALSRGNKHLEALAAIKEAQSSLESVLAWAEDCGLSDPGVVNIVKEAQALQCASLVAEAIELEPFAPPSKGSNFQGSALADDPWRPPEVARMHDHLYAEARTLAEEHLPASHPLATVARKLQSKTFEKAEAKPKGVSLPPISPMGQSASSPELGNSVTSSLGAQELRKDMSPKGKRELDMYEGADETAMSKSQSQHSGGAGGPASRSNNKRSSAQKLGRSQRAHNQSGHVEKDHDVFTDFKRHTEAEKEARRGFFHDSQEDDRKRLGQIHRYTRLMLELSKDDDLKDKKYSDNGHKIIMNMLSIQNTSRNDADLVKEARSAKEAGPEIHLVKKLSKKLFKKPPTPPPAPPPRAVAAESFKAKVGGEHGDFSGMFKVPHDGPHTPHVF
jgi:hypothetical protein